MGTIFHQGEEYNGINLPRVSWEANGILGAKNLLPYDLNTIKFINSGASGISWNDNVLSYDGATFTFNEDGTIEVNGSLATASICNIRLIANFGNLVSKYRNVILNGCPTLSADNKAFLVAQTSSSYAYDVGNGVELTDSMGITGYLLLQIRKEYTFNNIFFKPMIRLASDIDPTFKPYAMTNRELTIRGLKYKTIHSVAGSSSVPYPAQLTALLPYYNALSYKEISIIRRDETIYYYYGADSYVGFQRTNEGKLFVRIFNMSTLKCYDANNSLAFAENNTGYGGTLSLCVLSPE